MKDAQISRQFVHIFELLPINTSRLWLNQGRDSNDKNYQNHIFFFNLHIKNIILNTDSILNQQISYENSTINDKIYFVYIDE